MYTITCAIGLGRTKANGFKVGPLFFICRANTPQCNATFPTLEEPGDHAVETLLPECVIREHGSFAYTEKLTKSESLCDLHQNECNVGSCVLVKGSLTGAGLRSAGAGG